MTTVLPVSVLGFRTKEILISIYHILQLLLKPVTTEKAVKLIDIDNTIVFEIPRQARKTEIKKEVEKTLSKG